MAVALAPLDDLDVEKVLQELYLDEIVPAPDNPRRDLGDLTELAASMSELGLLQPLVVTPRAGKFMVVCGHRRYGAAKKAALTTVPAIVRHLDEPQRIKAMLIENCQREGLATIEEARAYAQLVELGLTQRQIAGDVGKTQSHISKRLALLDLPEKTLAEVDSGRITIADALELVTLKDHPKYLKKVIGRPNWQPLQQAIAGAKQDIERDERYAAAAGKLKAKGITPYKLDQYGYVPAPAKALGKGWNSIDIAVKEHEKLDCHAVGINPRTGDLVPVCTKPDNHPQDAEQHQSPFKPTAQQKAEAKERGELEAAAEARLAFIETIATGKVTKDDLAEISLFALFQVDSWVAFEWACRMLDVPIPSAIVEARAADTVGQTEEALDDPYKDLEVEEAIEALTDYAGQSAAARLRASFALAACFIEEHERARWNPWGAGARALLNVLERHGYKPTPIEKKKLNEARKEQR